MFVSVPYSELCLGSMKAGRGLFGEQACCSALPAARMQSLQLCVVSQLSAAFPAQPLGCPWSFALGTGRAAASVRGVAGSRCVPGRGRGLSRTGLRRAKPLLPAAQPFGVATRHQPSAGSKWCLLRGRGSCRSEVQVSAVVALVCLPSELGS